MTQAFQLLSLILQYLPSWLLLLGLPLYLSSQSDFQFKSYTQEGSTSTNTIRSIVQDDQGFIWMATDNGLSRFDGQAFLRFRFDPADSNSITSNQVAILALDSQQNLWIGTTLGVNRLNLINGTLERINLKINDKPVGPAQIRYIFEDQAHHIWVGTQAKGLFKLTPTALGTDLSCKHFQHNFEDERSQSYPNTSHFIEDDLGHLWIGSSLGFDRMDKQTETFYQLSHPILADPKTYLTNISKDHLGNIIFAIQTAGVFYIDPTEDQPKIRPYFELDFDSLYSFDFTYSTILQDRQKQYWLGTGNGLIIIDSTKTHHTIFRHTPAKVGTLSSSKIRSLYENEAGEMWIGTYGGLNRKKQTVDGFNYSYYQNSTADQRTISSGQIRTITEDLEGKIWVGHLTTGLEQFDWKEPEQQLVKLQSLQYNPSQEKGLLSNDIIQVFVDRKGFLWIGTNGQGLNKLDPRTGQMEAFVHDPNDPTSLSGNRIWGICEDTEGFIWVGEFTTGLNRLDPETGQVKRYVHQPDNPNSLSHNRIKTILRDAKGQLWIGTNLGLNKFDPSAETFTHYFNEPQDEHSLSSSYVYSLYEDMDQNLWVGTTLGLNKLSAENRREGQGSIQFERFYEGDGLPSNNIFGIQGDDKGNLWVGTDNGMARLLPSKEKITFSILDTDEKIRYGTYPPKAHYYSKSKDRFFFGAQPGLMTIQTTAGGQSKASPHIKLGEIAKYSEMVQGSAQLIDRFVANTKELVLTHHDRIVSFKFSDLDWDKSKTYEYQLIGFDNEWRKLPERMEATFTNLAPGRYTLMARGRDINNKTTASTQLLSIKVYPPWWKSGWAYVLYFLATLGLAYVIFVFQLKRQKEKREKENLAALNDFKDKLYTNITHEFRTPLTVISGVIDQIPGHDTARALIRRNSNTLLNLVNQILDLRKLKSGKLKLELIQSDIVAFAKELMASFEAFGHMKNITFQAIAKEEKLLMDFDKEKLERILMNLFSNAVKFTPAHGNIYLHIEKIAPKSDVEGQQEQVKIEVSDTGIGIPIEQQKRIFDRFYQVEQDLKNTIGESKGTSPVGDGQTGTGIGLAITKELVDLMDGQIDVKSKVGQGTTFSILIPIHREAYLVDANVLKWKPKLPQADQVTKEETDVPPIGNPKVEKLRLLVIEDNIDVAHYLRMLLSAEYDLLFAKDGQAGIETAFEEIPDLIISDVVMPKKDGFEVCEQLKNDLRTSHIPIILLTAKTSIESRITGLKRGADAYLSKPFDQQELLVRLTKLIALRQHLQNRYQGLSAQYVEDSAPESLDFEVEDEFMAKLLTVVETNMQNPNFDTTELCNIMEASRTQLHLKIKALTNRSTTGFIRTMRLKKSKELLLTEELNISQVAYEVGFKDPAYFSRKFSAEYGISPKKFAASQL